MDLSFMQNEIVLALCWTLIHSLWQGLLLAAVTGAVMIGTRRSSAGKRYRLLTGLFFVFMAVTIITFVKEYNSISGAGLITGNSQTTNSNAQILSAVTIVDATVAIDKPLIDRFKDYFNTHAALIVLIWLVIFTARFIRLTANLAYVQRLKNYKTFAPPAEWDERINELIATLGLKRKIKLLESGAVKVPVVIGVLKPVVLLPLGLLAHLPADEIEAILLHELAHIQRRDYLVNLLQNFAETIFFFNPALMWVSSMIREERENCCDDIAISVTNNKSRFINALIAFQEYNFSPKPYTVGFMGRKNQLLNRVKRIVNEKNKTLNAAEKSVLTFAMGVFILFSFAAAKKIAPPAVKDVLLSLEAKHADKTPLLPVQQHSVKMQIENDLVAVYNDNNTQPGITSDTVIKNTRHTNYGEVVKYNDPVNTGGYARYGEVVKYLDLVNNAAVDTVPGIEKRQTSQPSNLRSVYGEEWGDSISGQFANITTNVRNDDITISATHKNGTEYKFRKLGGVIKEFYVNGTQVNDVEHYRSVISDMEKASEFRRMRSKQRHEEDMARQKKGMEEKQRKVEERLQEMKEKRKVELREVEERIEEKRAKINWKTDSARAWKKGTEMKTKYPDTLIWLKGRGAGNDKVVEEVREVVLDKAGHDTRRLTLREKDMKFNKEIVVKDVVLGKIKPDTKRLAIKMKDVKPGEVEERDVVLEKIKRDTDARVKEYSKIRFREVSDSARGVVEMKMKESINKKRDLMRINEEKDRLRLAEHAKIFKAIIADLEKEGVKINLETSWIALDKDQFVVDGKKMSKELHEKFISKFVTSAEGWGYYYGPIQVRGRGIVLDYKDIAK